MKPYKNLFLKGAQQTDTHKQFTETFRRIIDCHTNLFFHIFLIVIPIPLPCTRHSRSLPTYHHHMLLQIPPLFVSVYIRTWPNISNSKTLSNSVKLVCTQTNISCTQYNFIISTITNHSKLKYKDVDRTYSAASTL